MAQISMPILIDWDSIIDYLAKTDIAEVVRCKDCKHYWKNKGDGVAVCLASPKDDAFCSEGVRKETEDA